jgi:hypothetical protein
LVWPRPTERSILGSHHRGRSRSNRGVGATSSSAAPPTAAPTALRQAARRSRVSGLTAIRLFRRSQTNELVLILAGGQGTGTLTLSGIPATTLQDATSGSGTVEVAVTTERGTSATSSSDQFSYISPPAVTGVNPNSGPEVASTGAPQRSSSVQERALGRPFDTSRVGHRLMPAAQIVCADTRLLTTIALTANAVHSRATNVTSAHGQWRRVASTNTPVRTIAATGKEIHGSVGQTALQ